MEMRNLEGRGMGKGIMLPSRECKESKRLPARRSCFSVLDLLGWLKDLGSSGDTLARSHSATQGWEPAEVALRKGVRGLGREGPAL